MIEFIYYGEIKGKGRPRFRSCGKFVQTYTDKSTKDYEMSIKESYINAKQETFFNEEPLEAEIEIYQAVPKSTSKKKTQEMLDGLIRPTKKPDVDNILKSVFDSLNKVAYGDDTQIVSVKAVKHYAINNYMVVRIKKC